MDDRRFDDLTKLVGRRASRRAVLKAAIAGAIASVFGGGVAQAALSPIKTRPKTCIQPGQPCGRPGIDPSRDCCYKCNSTTKKCCEDLHYVCTRDSDCCVKVVNGVNVQPICRDPQAAGTDKRKTCQLPGTLNPGAQCTQGSECASGNCVNGVCSACPVGTTTCGVNCCNTAQCQTCVNGVCKSKCGPCQRCENGTCVNTCTKCQTCTNGVCTAKTCPPCQICNPDTGLCVSTCGKCEKCSNGVCVPKCTSCQTCDPNTGVCSAKTCPNCQTCNPATGACGPKVCGACQECNPDNGLCESTCSNCQVCRNNVCVAKCPDPCVPCDPYTGICTPLDCGGLDDGACQIVACEGGACVASPVDDGTACTQTSTNEGTCCGGECCQSECNCEQVGEENVCIFLLGDLCFDEDECLPGQYCGFYNMQFFCLPLSCAEDPCPPGSVCDAGGACRPLCNHCLTVGCAGCTSCNAETGACEPGCAACEFCDVDSEECISECGDTGRCCGGACCELPCRCQVVNAGEPDEQGFCVFDAVFSCLSSPNDCMPHQFCEQGTCIAKDCTSDDDCSGASCIDGVCLALCTDCRYVANCGECEACNAETGVCEPGGCDPGLTCCDATCVDLQTTLAHCGDCDTACTDPEVCQNGNCCLPSGPASACVPDASVCCSGWCSETGACCNPGGTPCDINRPWEVEACCSGICLGTGRCFGGTP